MVTSMAIGGSVYAPITFSTSPLEKKKSAVPAWLELKKHYLSSHRMPGLFTPHQKPLHKYYVNLVLFEKAESKQIVLTEKNYLSPEQIYTHAPDDKSCVMIAGNAGMGKTVLCQRITYQWANTNVSLWRDYFSSILLIPLRRLRYLPHSCDTLAALVHTLYPMLGSHEAIESLCELTPPPLWVLDGYDEVQGKLADQPAALLEMLWAQKHVLLTSRLHAIDGSTPYDQRFDLVGFRRAERRAYITQFFEKKPECGAALLSFIHSQAHLRDMSRTPLHVEILCHLFDESPAFITPSIFDASTQLYEKMLTGLLQRQSSKEDEKGAIKSRLPVKARFDKPLHWLQCIAFEAHDELIIDKELIYRTLEKTEQGDFDPQFDALLTLNVLRAVDEIQGKYEFIHLSFQEFLAAQQFVALLRSQTTPVAQTQLLKTHLAKRAVGQEKFFWFTAGLLNTDPDLLTLFF